MERHILMRVLHDVHHTLVSQGRMRIADAPLGATLTEQNSSLVDHELDLAAIELAQVLLERWGAKSDYLLDELTNDYFIKAILRHKHPALLRWREAREKRRQQAEASKGEPLPSDESDALSRRLAEAIYGKDRP